MALTPATGAITSLTPTPLTAVGAGQWVTKTTGNCAIQVILSGTGAVSASVEVETSLGPSASPVAIATSAADISMSDSNGLDSDGFIMKDAPWKYIRVRVTSISGTGAQITGLMGS